MQSCTRRKQMTTPFFSFVRRRRIVTYPLYSLYIPGGIDLGWTIFYSKAATLRFDTWWPTRKKKKAFRFLLSFLCDETRRLSLSVNIYVCTFWSRVCIYIHTHWERQEIYVFRGGRGHGWCGCCADWFLSLPPCLSVCQHNIHSDIKETGIRNGWCTLLIHSPRIKWEKSLHSRLIFLAFWIQFLTSWISSFGERHRHNKTVASHLIIEEPRLLFMCLC
jgi:hypothetical protein